jgi:predicted permease
MFLTLFDVVLPVFLVIGAGYLATARGYFTDDHIQALMKFAQGFAIPCLLFAAIAQIDLRASFDPALLISFYTGAAICFALGMLGAHFLFKRDWEDSIAIGFCCLFSNSVLLGLAITERAYGVDKLTGNYAIIAFHAPFCYGLGVTAMEFARSRGKTNSSFGRAVLKSMFSNVLILAILAGFIVNLSGLPIPSAVDSALSLIIRAALPAALFALGGVLVRYRPEGDLRVIAYVCVISLMAHPALVWMIGTTTGLNKDFFRSAVLNSSMAPGVNAYLFANMYGRAKRVAASSVLLATGLSVFSVWMWLGILG